MKKLSEQELHERQVKIERRKLSIKSNIFCVLSALFMFAGAIFPAVVKFLAAIAGDDMKMKVICILASIIYLAVTLGLSIFFSDASFWNNDDFIPVKFENGSFVRKHRSEILAERKLEKKGLIKCEKEKSL